MRDLLLVILGFGDFGISRVLIAVAACIRDDLCSQLPVAFQIGINGWRINPDEAVIKFSFSLLSPDLHSHNTIPFSPLNPNQFLGKMDKKTENGDAKKIMSPCDVEALKKCLEENKGDHSKCQSQVEAFRASCSLKKQNSPPLPAPKLRRGAITDM